MMKESLGTRLAKLAKPRRLLLYSVTVGVAAVLAVTWMRQPLKQPPPLSRAMSVSSEKQAKTGILASDEAEDTSQRRPSNKEPEPSLPTSDKKNQNESALADSGASKDAAGGALPSLWHMDSDAQPSPAQLRETRRHLQALAARGEAAITEVRWYLQSGDGVGSSALRLELFEVLRQIGGSEAEAVLFEELQVTTDPQEVAVLATILDELAPQAYRDLAVQAARDTLALAWQGELEGHDVTPLMGVLRDFEEPRDAARELHRNLWKEWGPAAMVALAELERGQGIALVERMARSSIESDPFKDPLTDRRLLALRVLAQVAADSPRAQGILLEQASADRIPEWYWPALASALSGTEQLAVETQAGVAYEAHQIGNQVIYSKRGGEMSDDAQASARLQLIDELLAVSTSPDGIRSLQGAASLLAGGGYR